MRRLSPFVLVLLACAAIATMPCTGIAQAATCEKWAGKVVSAQGVVEVKRAGQSLWEPAKLNETYCPGDSVRTDKKSRADIALYNHPILRLDQNSTVTLGGMKDERTSLVDMISGAALFFSRVTRNLEVRTATVNAGVEGTEFFIRAEEGKTELTVFEGKVLAANAAGGLPVTTGQSAVAEAGKAPVYRVVVRPRDAVQWALYYPPVLDSRPKDLKEDGNDPRFYTARASQLLAVGRVDEATADIDKAQKLDPKNSDAFALQAMIAVTQNEKGKALELARKAVEADPNSATARIALSYAQQANFDLPGARGSLEEAVKLSPGNALAWARLAELQQSFGDLDKSLDSAKKAAALSPDLSRTQTVLGFSHLTRVETVEAKGAFEKAIKLDDADPLPRLGMGLAKIREGHLEEGRREIEIAMSLDPNSSIIRSYLGKAYYEEKRDKLATGQYEMAKSLDPSDPTPYFYDAIEKQTTNRPVEALHDLEKSIELNDNRAVYRSRLLLDSDLAARSASLGRIYSDLGFQQRALVEGWKSVNTDPTDFSGHRFLADTYAALPRHEIARVSELLQSQLLQPTNITPIQPRLAESNLFLISSGGPGSLSFNEFNPVFNRDGVSFLASGLGGENSTWAGEGVLSGIYKKASFSLGYTHFETDGWRTNANQNDDIANAFFQLELSPDTSIQAEYRYRDTNYGDLQLRFFPEDVFIGQTYKVETNTYRLGARHRFSPDSILLGSFVYQDVKYNVEDTQPVVAPGFVTFYGLESPRDAYNLELQHLYRSQYVNFTTGAGYAHINGTDDLTVMTVLPPPDDVIRLSTDESRTHTNLYMYSYIKPQNNLTLTAGVSGDFINSEASDKDKDQWNPKFGVVWNPDQLRGTTFRAAAFRVMKRSLVTNQTLEPTQVAGFNQFYDDFFRTNGWTYGGAIDQKFSRDIFGGVELSGRDLNVPASDQFGNEIWAGWKESLSRIYFLWTPHSWVGLRAEYQYERIKRDAELTDGVKEMDTVRLPLGINFFHPCGLGASVTATYYNQDGTFERVTGGGGVYESGSDTFWLTDIAINYRLPERYGFVTVGARNLFDEDFKYYDTDWKNPAITPARSFYGRITLAF